jgi:hypothetical protein
MNGMSTIPDAAGLLHLLSAEPTLMPPAPATATGSDIEHRRHDEAHACLHCGQRAETALIADTTIGRRWLDLCMDCLAWLRVGAEQ